MDEGKLLFVICCCAAIANVFAILLLMDDVPPFWMWFVLCVIVEEYASRVTIPWLQENEIELPLVGRCRVANSGGDESGGTATPP